MKQTRFRRAKRAIAKALVTGFAAFAVLTAGPMLAPRKANASTFFVCKETNQTKIVQKFLAQKVERKSDKMNVLRDLLCLGRNGILTPSQKLMSVLIPLSWDSNNNVSKLAFDVLPKLEFPKPSPFNMSGSINGVSPRIVQRHLFAILERFAGTEIASRAVKLVFDNVKRFRSEFWEDDRFAWPMASDKIRQFKFLEIREAELMLYAGAPKDKKKAFNQLVGYIEKGVNGSLIAANALFAYMINDELPDKIKLSSGLKLKISSHLTNNEKRMHRRNLRRWREMRNRK